MKTNWITFYSYKGGVGRSMALANVAAHLASMGRRVVMIDFDLEAPGLDSFEEFSAKGAAGVVEYIDAFRRTKTTPPIEQYVHRCSVELEAPGALWLMPSGRKDAEYAELLHRMDWSILYDSGIAEPFIANWKKAIERSFQPDYVLVDSRTGLTDVGGVCTLHFPDIVVLLFALNRQNLYGTSGVRRAIAQAQRRDPIEMIAVASPIPNLAREAGSPLDLRLREAQRILETKINAVISYFPSIVLEEALWTLKKEFPQPKIVEDYRNITGQIISRLRNGFDFVLNRARRILETQDEAAAEAVINSLQVDYSERAESQRMIASLERLRQNREGNLNALKKALSIDPTDKATFIVVSSQYRTLGRLGEFRTLAENVHSRLAVVKGPRERGMLNLVAERYMQIGEYKKALDAYLEASELCTDDVEKKLIVTFNIAEARRRLTREIFIVEWFGVLDLIDHQSATIVGQEDPPSPEELANRMQALHIALGVTGKVLDAKLRLEKALAVAATLNDAASVFSVADYSHVPVREFVRVTQGMLEALDRGELWDGMKLQKESSALAAG